MPNIPIIGLKLVKFDQNPAIISYLLILSIPSMQFYKKHSILAFCLLACVALGGFVYVKKSHQNYSPACKQGTSPFSYTLCQLDPKENNLKIKLAWQMPDSTAPMLEFSNLLKVAPNTRFAMNAGMYDDKFAPIGYTVIDGKQIKSLNLKNGGGNFHLMPNGVFWWDENSYHVTESQAFNQQLTQHKITPKYATQSGPMLVINGQIHPDFDKNSESLKIRNGVGICQDGTVKFVASDALVSFYAFADFFKTTLKCDNALFLDGGRATAVYSKELNRQDNKYMGVMVVAEENKAN